MEPSKKVNEQDVQQSQNESEDLLTKNIREMLEMIRNGAQVSDSTKGYVYGEAMLLKLI